MIASVEGVVTALTPDGLVVRVGGVGLALHTTPGTKARARVGEQVAFATSLVVREDSLTLYGFGEDDERLVFEMLQSASGIGPRVAQAVLSVHAPDAVRRALLTEDLAALCLVPGIGKKGAQRMVLELKDKAAALGVLDDTPAPVAAGLPAWQATLGAALGGLGFTTAQVDDAVARLAESRPDATDADVPVLLKEALAMLGRAR
ncbi:MAG: Holliday junction branch migration protein RuvA [Mycobacteriales bacterium]|nr:Holliday junction branch migration protein RuvA [Mycobacteriales bacterium]